MSPHSDAGPAWLRLEDQREWEIRITHKDVLGSGRIEFDGWFAALRDELERL
jgi:hypothetical protein